jgi:hypothetical protein
MTSEQIDEAGDEIPPAYCVEKPIPSYAWALGALMLGSWIYLAGCMLYGVWVSGHAIANWALR